MENSVVSVVSEQKCCSEHNQRFHFSCSEVKERSERSEKFRFSSGEIKTV